MKTTRIPGIHRVAALLALACLAAPRLAAQPVLPRNAAAAGLWMGDVSLDRVGGASGPVANPDPTSAPLRFRILLHADTDGRVRLLKDVVVAKRDTPVFDPVLVTDPSKLATLDLERNKEQAIAGRRFTTVGYDFAGTTLPFDGGLGAGFTCTGTVILSNTAPTNPFRHPFHPDHGNTGSRAITVQRQVTVTFAAPAASGVTIDQVPATYDETVTGLIGTPVTVRGSVVMRRISRTAILNQ